MANPFKPGDMVEIVRPMGPVPLGTIFKVTRASNGFVWIDAGPFLISEGGWSQDRFVATDRVPKTVTVTMQDIPVWSLDELEQANAIIKELT